MKRFPFLLLINLLPLFFILLRGWELGTIAINGTDKYPWGESGIDKAGWIYISPEVYILYAIVFVATLIALVLLSLRASKTGKWSAYLFMLVVSVAIYFTPLLPIM